MDENKIVRIEPSPFKKTSVKVQRSQVKTIGGKVQYKSSANGKRKPITEFVNEDKLLALPGTKRVYKQPLTKKGIKTGLDALVHNPYKDEDYYRDNFERVLKDKDKVMLQYVLEYKHGVDLNHYTNKGLNSRTTNAAFAKGQALKFFQSPESNIVLEEGVTMLDLSIPKHEVLYYSCLEHPKIANSYEDLMYKPKATHFIVNAEKQAKRKSEKTRKYNQAGSRLEELYGLTDNTIQKFCKVLDVKRKNLNKDEAYSELETFYRQSDDNLAQFNYFYDLWKNIPTRERFEANVEVYDYLAIALITSRENKYFWTQPDPETGKRIPWTWESKDKLIDWLLDPAYQEEVEVLEQMYKARKSDLE